MPPSVAHDPPPEAVDCVAYLNEAWTPYHAVLASCRRLAAAGYEVRDRIDRSPLLLSAGAHMRPIQRPSRLRPPVPPPLLTSAPLRRSPPSFSSPRRFRFPSRAQEISERDAWALKPGGKYFFTRNMSALCAFAVGAKYAPGSGFVIVGAHTDSPCPRLKPCTKAKSENFLQVRTQNYGGGLWYTWFDRDLGVAGRVLVRRPDAETPGESRVSHELVKIERPVMRIPSLAIHLDRSLNDGFKVNFQQHMAPVIADAVEAELGAGPQTKTPADETRAETKKRRVESSDKHHPVLLDLLAEALGCEREDVLDFELQLCDTQPSAVGGAKGEYIFSGRLDNLQSCYCSLTALIAASSDESLEDETAIRMIAHYDHEEVGSDSAQGAGSSMTEDALRRVVRALNAARGSASAVDNGGLDERTRRASFCVSADMAHAVHPNYADRHEPGHRPRFGEGVVIKHNANQRYATDAVTGFLFRELGERAGVPVQEFVVRSDLGCGSTIGPTLSTNTGIRTVDVGAPQLSMHSVREQCSTKDVAHAVAHYRAVFEGFSAMDEKLRVDGNVFGNECKPCK